MELIYGIIIIVCFFNVITSIKILMEYNKLCDKNLKLLRDNLGLQRINEAYEDTINTLIESNMKLMPDKPIEVKINKRGRKKKNNDL